MSTPTVPSYRSRVGYQGMLLGGFTLLACALLVMGNVATKEPIAERAREDLLASLAEVIPADLHENDLLADTLNLPGPDQTPITLYRARTGSEMTAFAWPVVGKGYAGDITLLLAVDAQGVILGVRVLSHAETPGLGDKIEISKDKWITDFNGHSLDTLSSEQWRVNKDGGVFDAFSGATITPRAVVKAIHEGLLWQRAQSTTLHAQATLASGETTHGD